MTIELHYFGWMREKLGTEHESLELSEGASVAELRTALGKAHPELKGMSYRIAKDRQLVQDENEGLGPDSEIALLPAFAGG